MSTPVAMALIAIGSLLATALGLAGGALWRLGSKVGGFEAAVLAANQAATAAKQAAQDAQAAAQRAAADAVAAARLLYEDMQRTVREFQLELQDVKSQLAEARGRWRESHDLSGQMLDHEKRLVRLERDHERNHPAMTAETSRRTLMPVPEEGAPEEIDGLFEEEEVTPK